MPPKGRGRGRGVGGRDARGGGRAVNQQPPTGAYWEEGENGRSRLKWTASDQQPHFIDRNLELLDGERYARRPAAIARRAGKRRASEVLLADEFEGSRDSWATANPMPDEYHEEDVGWFAGPIVRERPVFRGPTPGPTNATLNDKSTEVDIMLELLTPAFKELCQLLTIAHVREYRLSHPNWRQCCVERAFGKKHQPLIFKRSEEGRARFSQLFDVWLAAKVRIAVLKPEVPCCALWGMVKEAPGLYDRQLDLHLTFHQFQWCNRHFSFGLSESDDDRQDDADVDELGKNWDDSSFDGEQDDDSDVELGVPNVDEELHELRIATYDGDEGAVRRHDTYAKRRLLTDFANRCFANAYNPHQHCGLDEATRSTKHWEKIRIRFKAAVHSGTLVDMLNDCVTNYCLWFEEQTWHSKELEGSEVNSTVSRIRRAARCLVEKQMDDNGRSTANYCISLDRGYGHVEAQQQLWKKDGVFSNAMMQANRIGLPREFISQVGADLAACPANCTHKPGEKDCRKFMWTVVNKPPFELALWQDSQLILCYGNFFSGSRAGLLSRGAAGDKESYSIWTPESIFHYNIEGRSATDSSDQARGKLTVAERRIERAGHKGISFVLDIALTNGFIIQKMLQPVHILASKLHRSYTKVLFCMRWSNSIMTSCMPFRRRTFSTRRGQLSDSSASLSRDPSLFSAPSSTPSPLIAEHHKLIDVYMEEKLRDAHQKKRGRGRPKKCAKIRHQPRGLCGAYNSEGKFVLCGREGYPERSSLFCVQCKRYYHMPCFFSTHSARLMK